MHRKLCTYALSGFLTLGMAAGTVFAQDNSATPSQTAPMPMRGHHRMSPERQLKHMTKQLDLTSDQQSQIKPILEARHQQMQEAWKDKSLSKQDRREKMMEIQKDTSRKIKTVLNDTQKKKYEDMQMKMRDRMMHRNMHRGMGTGMGQGMMGQDSKPQPATSSQPPQ